MSSDPMTSIGNSVHRWQQRLFKLEYCTVLKVDKKGQHGIQCHSPDHPEYYNTVTVKVRNAKEGIDPTKLEHPYEIVIQDFVGNCFGHPWTPRVGDLVQVLFLYNTQPIILGPVNTTYQAPPMRGPTCADAMYDEVWKWCQWLEPTQDKNHDYKDHPKGKMPICRKLFHGPVTGLPDGKGRDEMFVWDCQMGDAEPTCKDCWIVDSLPRDGEQWFKQYSTKTESLQAYNSRAEWHSRCGSYLRFESDDENPTGNPSLEYSEGIGHIRLGNATTENTKKGHINFHPTGTIDMHGDHEELALNQEVLGARTMVTGSGLTLTDGHGTIACESIYLPLQAYSRIYRDGSIHHTANNNSEYGRSKLYLETDGTCGLWNIVSNDYVEITDEEITLDSPLTHVTGDLQIDGSCTHNSCSCEEKFIIADGKEGGQTICGDTEEDGVLTISGTSDASKGQVTIDADLECLGNLGSALQSTISALCSDVSPVSEGVAGGQSLCGGTASGDDLSLTSTSNGTKGSIFIQPDGGDVDLGTNAASDLWVNGDITAEGSLKMDGKLSMRPFIEIGKIAQNSKPTIVQRGATSGYSLPIYNSDQEELYISEYIAGRWDGASNISMSIIGYLSGAEDVGDDFSLQVSWMNKSTSSGVVQDTTTDVVVETNIDTDRNAQYSIYKVDFAIDWDLNNPDILASDYFAARIRRIAVGAGKVEMSGEFVVTMIIITYNVDKVFKLA